MSDVSQTEVAVSDAIAAQARRFAVRLADPDVSVDVQTAFDEWLAADVRHERAYLRASMAYEAAGALKDVFSRGDPQNTARIGRSRGLWMVAGLAMAAAACVLVVLWPRPAAPPPIRFATAAAESKTIRLEDGSRVSLGSQTALEVAFTRERRMVRLSEGAAFFSVARDESRPFVITLARASVEVLGTQFEVKSVCGAVRVSVARGVVRFLRQPGVQQDAVQIPAGQTVELRSDGAFSNPGPARQIAEWRSGILSYNNATVCEIVSDANREGGKVIRVSDPALATLRITASYPAEQRNAMLASLEAALPIKVEQRDNGEIWLLPRR